MVQVIPGLHSGKGAHAFNPTRGQPPNQGQKPHDGTCVEHSQFPSITVFVSKATMLLNRIYFCVIWIIRKKQQVQVQDYLIGSLK